MNIQEIIKGSVSENKFIYGVFTTPRSNPYKKITARPINIKGKDYIQLEKFTDTQAFHENLNHEDALDLMVKMIMDEYRNINLFTQDADYQIMVSKKGNIKVLQKEPTRVLQREDHDKEKQYIIKENQPCDFLTILGVMNPEGQVYKKKYDKFKQINKFWK